MSDIEARAIAEAQRLAAEGVDAEALYARLGRQERAIARRPDWRKTQPSTGLQQQPHGAGR